MSDASSDSATVTRLLADKLAARCAQAKIPFEEKELFDDLTTWTLALPAGRESRSLSVSEPEELERLLAVRFEDYTFLSGYSAIANYGKGIIEAAVRVLDGPGPSLVLRRLGVVDDAATGAARAVSVSNGDAGITLTLAPSSQDLQTLTDRPPNALSLTISGVTVKRHDACVALLRTLANAYFFQVDLTLGAALMLQPEHGVTRRFRHRAQNEPSLEFPKHEYDPAPASLYWYARSARGMPLLQFLAYYQVIEFYFPICSQADARRRIQGALKDPAFRADRETDIGRILTLLKASGAGFGDERSQLRATFQECIDAADLRVFLGETPERQDFLSKKMEGLTDKRIQVGHSDADLRTDAADRIYDIRCRIVHTKSSATGLDLEMLLPFSTQAAQLSHDIELVQFVARRVLISMSSHLKLSSTAV